MPALQLPPKPRSTDIQFEGHCRSSFAWNRIPEKTASSASADPRETVLLVHGIRTHADWFQSIRGVLERHGFRVALSNYGRFDLVRFLMPINLFRARTQHNLFRQIRDTQKRYPNSRISIIAHSFGTYLIAKILQREFDLRIKRIIFIGSVVRYNFPFEDFSERFEGEILNEVGAHDPWPVLAESVTTGYGSTGTYGFKRERVFDVWKRSSHSEALSPDHCEGRWIPFLTQGTLPRESSVHKVPLWIRIISLFKIKYFICVLVMCIVSWCILSSITSEDPLRVRMYPGDSGWSLTDDNIARTVNEKLDGVCKLEELFGLDCNGALGKYLTGRDWRTVVHYDENLNTVSFPKKFELETYNPLEFWITLRDDYPDCIAIEDNGAKITLGYLPDCEYGSKQE